ncbi:MAG: cytochrome C oxidase subunit IV family protein [Flavobacteriaceae bacterium]|nr:cytochrome C oxidase subunit IV family protein [Flavobacteriaceae bacterium]
MKKQLNFKIWLVLLVISILAALIVKLDIGLNVAAAIILAFFMLKFLLVSFYFMELKKANIFWKWAVTIFASVFLAIVLIVF